MGIAQNVNTFYDYSPTDQYDFLSNWITSVANTTTPANVYSISWGQNELYTAPSFANVFNTEAIKLGVMGTSKQPSISNKPARGTNIGTFNTKG
jgi:hypothetical protein